MEHARQSEGLLKPPVFGEQWRRVLGSAIGLGLLVLKKKYQECCDVLEREDVESACRHSFIYFNLLGMSSRHLKFGETKARAAYEKALIIDPMRADTLYNLANLLKDEDQERADELYLKSLQINNWGAECWHNYGSNLTNLHFQEECYPSLKNSIFLDPSIADVWCNLGLAYYGLDRFDEAERCFRFSLSMDKSHAQSHINLGNTLISVFRPDEAVVLLERGLELDPSSHNSLWNLALAYLLLVVLIRVGSITKRGLRPVRNLKNCNPPHLDLRLNRLINFHKPAILNLLFGVSKGWAIQFSLFVISIYLKLQMFPFLFVARDSLFSLMMNWTGLSNHVIHSTSLPDSLDQRPHVPLMSLPIVFNTDHHTIPASVPYLQTLRNNT